MSQTRKGLLYAFAAYGTWGILPLYWKPLAIISPATILSYRIIFSAVLSWAIVSLMAMAERKKHGQITLFRDLRSGLGRSAIAALLIGVNWFTFIFAVMSGRTLQASLGYFLTPLISLLLGIIFLGERPGILRGTAVALGALSMVFYSIRTGSIPWVTLALAGSFGIYGYVKKGTRMGPFLGLGLETAWLLPLAVFLLLWDGGLVYLMPGAVVDGLDIDAVVAYPLRLTLLLLAGPVTLIPLVFFASGSRRIPLYVMGFVQYLGPILMFLVAWLFFNEPLGVVELFSFGLVWLALVLFSTQTIREHRRQQA